MQTKLILLMKEKNVTNKDLASKIGITDKQIGLKIKGIAKFNGDEMFEIASFFGKKVDDIFYQHITKMVSNKLGGNKNVKQNIKITCRKCNKTSFIQVISKKMNLYPKYCPKCGCKLSFLQKLKNHGMWILIGIHDNIKNH